MKLLAFIKFSFVNMFKYCQVLKSCHSLPAAESCISVRQLAVGVSSSTLNIYDCTSVTDLVIPAVNANLFSAFFQSSLKVAFPPIATYILLQVGNYRLRFFKSAWIAHLFMFLLFHKTTSWYKNSQRNIFQSPLNINFTPVERMI